MHLALLPYELIAAMTELMDPASSLALSAACSSTLWALKHIVAQMRRQVVSHAVRCRLELSDHQARMCRDIFLRFAPGRHGVLCLTESLPEMVTLSCTACFGMPSLSSSEIDVILKPHRQKRTIHVALNEFQEAVMRAKAHVSVRDALPTQLGDAELRRLFATRASLTSAEIDTGRSTGDAALTAHDCFQALCTVVLREAKEPILNAQCGLWQVYTCPVVIARQAARMNQ